MPKLVLDVDGYAIYDTPDTRIYSLMPISKEIEADFDAARCPLWAWNSFGMFDARDLPPFDPHRAQPWLQVVMMAIEQGYFTTWTVYFNGQENVPYANVILARNLGLYSEPVLPPLADAEADQTKRYAEFKDMRDAVDDLYTLLDRYHRPKPTVDWIRALQSLAACCTAHAHRLEQEVTGSLPIPTRRVVRRNDAVSDTRRAYRA